MCTAANSELGDLVITDSFPGVFVDHVVDAGVVVDYAGRSVCPGFELLGDFLVIDDVAGGDRPIVVVENRRALAADDGSGATSEIPRWHYDCTTGETVEVPSTGTVRSDPDVTVETRTTAGGLVLVTEWGLGDSPLRLTTESGLVLIDGDALAYDYLLSADERTVYATTYAGTGAASPPNGVIAVDVATGTERWRRGVGGFVWNLGDGLVIEEVEPQVNDLGIFVGREVVVVDPETGADLNRIGFTHRIVGLF